MQAEAYPFRKHSGWIAWFIVICILVSPMVHGQKMEVKGVYQGKNLFIINPDVGSHDFCLDSIAINSVIQSIELQSNTIEIDFSNRSIPLNSSISIQLYHKKACVPKLYNPGVIQQKSFFSIENPKVDKFEILSWKMVGTPASDTLYVEQFKWKKWVVVQRLPLHDSIKEYFTPVNPHSGYNMFRICDSQEQSCSVTAKYSSRMSPVEIKEIKPHHVLFSLDTPYELFNAKGSFVQSGEGREINIKDLPKGEYWLNFDNRTEKFQKK